jgi:large subunit ribosomal protein L4
MKLDIYNQKGEKVGDVKISSEIFDLEVNEALVHQAMVTQMANERQVVAHTKDRSEVRGGGKKPWKQKGTGRARAGSSRSPIWIGGGVTFGPTKDRNFTKKINKKMKQKALMMVLSDKVKNGNLVILEKFEIKEYKTKDFNSILKSLEGSAFPKDSKELIENDVNNKKSTSDKSIADKGNISVSSVQKKVKKAKRSILVVNEIKDQKTKYSGRNLTGVEIINSENINIVDLLKYRNLLITKDVMQKIEEKYKK